MLASLVLAAVTVLPQQPATGTVWGQVRSRTTGSPIAFAIVEVVGNGSPLRVQSNENGIYVLTNIPTGHRLIRATHIDHAPHEIEIMVLTDRKIGIDFDLELRPVRLPVVNARADGVPDIARDTTSTKAPDLGPSAVRALEATPGVAELGLAEAAGEVPGYEPVDPADVLFVRSGAADLKVVYLNGAPVFAPFNVGGLVNALDSDLYRSANLFLGGAPARYDGGLSYVMDLETRSGRDDGFHGSVSVDMLAAKVMVEGPAAGRASFIGSGRTVHGRGAAPFVGDPFPYEYGDAVGRVDVDLGSGRVLSVSGFWNRESVRLDSVRRPGQEAVWGNRAGSVRLRGDIGGSDALLTLAVGDFETQLPFGGLRVLLTEGVARRLRAAADFGRTIGPGRVHFGGSIDRLEFEQRVWPRGEPDDSTLFRSQTGGTVAGAYIDATANPFERLQLRGGIRADVFSLQPGIRLAPRLSATMLLSERVSLTVAAGRYRQYVRASEQPLAIVVTPGLAVPGGTEQLDVASASHLMAALNQDLGGGIRLSLEGFYKSFEGLPATTSTTAEASGVDLWVRRSTGAVTGWFGYSLAWVWSDDDRSSQSTHLFAGRQLMTAGLAGPVIGKGRFDVRVAYGAGLPFAAIPEPEAGTPVIGVGFADQPAYSMAEPVPSVPAAPDQPYLRLDAQIGRTWDADWRGFAFSVTPFVKVLNALNRRDGIFYYYEQGGETQARALAGLPVLPIVGVDWRF